jgi:rRNA maturation RNase YbeY
MTEEPSWLPLEVEAPPPPSLVFDALVDETLFADAALSELWPLLETSLIRLQTLFIEQYPIESWQTARPSQESLWAEVFFCKDAWIQQLNQQYRQKDTATDVLSFPLNPPTPLLADNIIPLEAEPFANGYTSLGSIMLSVDWALAQCNSSAPQTVQAFLLERVIHGLLHLSGQHHDTEADYQTVLRLQESILQPLMAPFTTR